MQRCIQVTMCNGSRRTKYMRMNECPYISSPSYSWIYSHVYSLGSTRELRSREDSTGAWGDKLGIGPGSIIT